MGTFIRVKVLNKEQYLVINTKHIVYVYKNVNKKGVETYNIMLEQDGFDMNGIYYVEIDKKTYDLLLKKLDYIDLVDEIFDI